MGVANDVKVKNAKVVVLGNMSVGKTSLIRVFVHGEYPANYSATIGIDFFVKTVGNIKMQLWDTAGQERFMRLIPSYVRDSVFAIIVFDITDRASFDNVVEKNGWIDKAVEVCYKAQRPVIPIMLVGNKCDNPVNDHKVTPNELQKVVEERGLLAYAIVSAKNNEGVDQMFNRVCELLPVEEDKKTKEQQLREISLYPSDPNEKKTSRCTCRKT